MNTANMRQLLRAAPSVFAARASLVALAKAFRMNYARLPICASYQHHMRSLSDNNRSKWHGLWEPSDLKTEPDIPEFDTIHISMKGFDYPVLESYAKYVHKAVDTMFDLESDAWPVPAKSTQIKTFHPNSAAVNDKYDLQKYERTVMVEDVPITTLPILLEFVRKNCPEGVEVFVKEPDPQEEEERYVPDYEVIELQKEKEAIAAGKLRKK
ncbi:39S ribosomal protein l48, mitochondrial [Plakobranchus ocellatus]|uniref:39S ribosomal protein l48, mitochondrial n=1 Tax=Plakobranchus ocellatus TaxID=259542 RepID=A0AAV4CRU6_9GAST|nr:39S ribosomal protein l48, mitochondrial [Plakobranchus ocellatus]